MALSSRSVVAFSWIVALGTAHAAVLVVDDDGGVGVDFTTLSAAVAAAQDGDAILVAAGTYDQPTVIDGKSILIQAEANATVDLGAAPLTIRNLAVTDVVAVRGIDGSGRWVFEDNDGILWIEDCDLLAGPIDAPANLVVDDSSRVLITRCRIHGQPVDTGAGDADASDAIASLTSTLFLYESDLRGGDGAVGVPAAHAVDVTGGQVQLLGCDASGGDGGPAAGGDGVRVANGATLRRSTSRVDRSTAAAAHRRAIPSTPATAPSSTRTASRTHSSSTPRSATARRSPSGSRARRASRCSFSSRCCRRCSSSRTSAALC